MGAIPGSRQGSGCLTASSRVEFDKPQYNAQDAKGLAIILAPFSPKDFSFVYWETRCHQEKKKDLPYNFAGTHQFGDVWDTSISEKVHKTKVNYSLCRTLFTSNICLDVLALTIFTSKY